MIAQSNEKDAFLKKVYLESRLPEPLHALYDLAHNLWWSWNDAGESLFRSIDPLVWESLEQNPVAMLDQITRDKAARLIADQAFMDNMNRVKAAFDHYMSVPRAADAEKIAYFCMEYGLKLSLHLYSGGLGILAGDYLKEASDQNKDMVAIGLLYKYGYFQQAISLYGEQVHNYPAQELTKLPYYPVRNANGEWLKVFVSWQGRKIWAKIWETRVGRISLYLLDADLDENNWEDRSLTHHLYGGDTEHRLKQEILLGIGGVRILETLGIKPEVFHCNEGHAAFMGLERIRVLTAKEKLSFDEALEYVRATSLFTTHTPVPAGHDYFSEHHLGYYLFDYVRSLGISWERFMAMGKLEPHNPGELFSMSHLAIRLCRAVNGVSKLHGKVSREMFNNLYPDYDSEELYIGHVTNGVHYPTWVAHEWKALSGNANSHLEGLTALSDEQIFRVRTGLKKKLIRFVKEQLQSDLTRRGESPRFIFEVLNQISENALVIGFARRFATYKRANLLFKNLDRLRELISNAQRPVLFLYSGKAHPADKGGQALIQKIVNISREPEFRGKIVFLENYNVEIAKMMVQGVDLWLNTPTRDQEASGTSGMKAALNGVLNFSVLDGWWVEGYQEGAGWALPLERTYKDQALQDELDAEAIFNTLEYEIIPAYFDRDEVGIPSRWMQYVRNIMGEVGPFFTTTRMLQEYTDQFYRTLKDGGARLAENGFAGARKYHAWKQWIRENWGNVRILDKSLQDTDNFALQEDQPFEASVKILTGNIAADHIGGEVVFFSRHEDGSLEYILSQDMQAQAVQAGEMSFHCSFRPNISGVYEFGIRLFPQHPWMPHRQDLDLVMWV